jgi:hypothetical protein
MIRSDFRPWGDLTWMLDHLQAQQWAFACATSMEDRCLAAMQTLQDRGGVGESLIFRIQDADSRYFEETEKKTDANEALFKQLGRVENDFQRRLLLGRYGDIASDIATFLNRPSVTDLIIDISSLPKKIFFLLIRKALEQPEKLQNIVITYTEPESYCSSPLAENPEGWNPLPGFLPPRTEPADKILVIGLGYEPLGLPELYSSGLFSNASIRLLFPFPAQPSSVSRNWDFARLLEPVPGNTSQNIVRIDSYNVPDIFDKLVSITGNGDTYSILAPFGPKPMSLAMCLFASAYSKRSINPSVFYTQPTVYNPNYSIGIKMRNGKPCVSAYCIRLNGRNLYQDD